MVFDCGFDLLNPLAGPQMHALGHIPGAVYANLDTALSAKGEPYPGGAASGGRHPLPTRENFSRWLSGVGFDNTMQAVVYDSQGANYCGRLWWMLKWMGHARVAVLDGGLQAWRAAGGALDTGNAAPLSPSSFALAEPIVTLVDAGHVMAHLGSAEQNVLDARGLARFKGESEPIDPVAGHIPGALNRPFSQNLGADGLFKAPHVLRAEFEDLLGARDPSTVVHQCGSGVSAVPNLLAMAVAGLGMTSLYAGSWSDWCSNPQRPVAQG
jgi:thiosulfate/3-mercaptopyruvate sulfurtransferase